MHHGPEGWRGAPELGSMFDAGSTLLEAARPFQPHFRFVLDDIAALSLDALASRALGALTRLVQLAFWSSHSFQRLQDAAPLMAAIRSGLGRTEPTRALLVQLYVYLWRVQREVDADDVRTILLKIAGPEGQEDVMTAGEQLIQQGLERGLQRGQAQALRGAVASVLSARGLPCSEENHAKLAACDDVSLLTRWHARAVTAPSEAEIFAEG